MYYGTISEKPLLCGSISHISPREILLRETIPLITQTGFAMDGKNHLEPTDILSIDFNETNLNALVYFNVKYVILHKDQMTSTAYQTMASYLNTLLGAPCYDDKAITAYEVNQTAPAGIFAYLTDDWWNVEAQNGWPIRWLRNNGTVQIISPAQQFCSLNFTVGTQYTNKTLNVSLNGELLGNYRVINCEPRQLTLSILLKKGVNELSFYCNQTFVPSQLTGTTTDNRLLSVYIKNVQLS